jgi:hypothetical protein
MREITQLLIPGVTLQRTDKRTTVKGKPYNYVQYYVYIPKKFEALVKDKEWLVTVILDDQEIPIGLKRLTRHNKHYIITLPSNLAVYWEKYVYREVMILLERPG